MCWTLRAFLASSLPPSASVSLLRPHWPSCWSSNTPVFSWSRALSFLFFLEESSPRCLYGMILLTILFKNSPVDQLPPFLDFSIYCTCHLTKYAIYCVSYLSCLEYKLPEHMAYFICPYTRLRILTHIHTCTHTRTISFHALWYGRQAETVLKSSW